MLDRRKRQQSHAAPDKREPDFVSTDRFQQFVGGFINVSLTRVRGFLLGHGLNCKALGMRFPGWETIR